MTKMPDDIVYIVFYQQYGEQYATNGFKDRSSDIRAKRKAIQHIKDYFDVADKDYVKNIQLAQCTLDSDTSAIKSVEFIPWNE